MKKKVLSLLLAAVMVVGLVGCSSKKDDTSTGDGKFELALVTDVGTIDDKSFNQGCWEGLSQYAEENNITHKYYKPAEQSDAAYLDSIDLAVKGGAKMVVVPGFLFSTPIYEAQTKYPDVKFVQVDGAPTNADGKIEIKENAQGIVFAEEQAGYLAGYGAVKDGYTKLGFMGGMAVPAVVRFGHGYIQGAQDAAKEMGIKDVEVKYTYLNTFGPAPEVETKAASWYKGGTEVIFACAGGAGNSVMKAAEGAKTKVIGVDVDQSTESETVITSSMKNLKKAVYDAVASLYTDDFKGGVVETLGAAQGGVELPMETSKFEKFDQAQYDKIFKALVDGNIKITTDAKEASDIKVNDIKVVVE